MNRRTAISLLLIAPSLAWLLVFGAAWLPWADISGSERRLFPSLPLVSVPYVADSDVVSLVPDLFRALTIALLAVVLVEVAKVSSLRLGGVGLYAAMTAYQATLGLDAMRYLAPDWYGYSLFFAGLIELRHDTPRPDLIPLPAPYMALAALIAVAALAIPIAMKHADHEAGGTTT